MLTDEQDGPECETCGKTTCPDADLPGFSEPRNCALAPIYHAIRDAKDCDYGCARDLTNQSVRRQIAPAVEAIVSEALAARETELREQIAALASALDRTERNFRLAVAGKPVRDMTENLAENRAARIARATQ